MSGDIRRLVFVGPTLRDARSLPECAGIEVHPPIASGDLLLRRLRAGDTVAIIDGYFHQARSIGHKEILAAMADGVRVAGAASMGALRAAELAPLGMVGIGSIFDAYRRGTLVADDEVTLIHAMQDDDYRPLSEPLVNLRATLVRAVEEGQCTEPLREHLVGRLAALGYRHRTVPRVLALAAQWGADTAAVGRLRTSLTDRAVDVKRADALAACAWLTRPAGADPPVARVPAEQPTVFLYAQQLQASSRIDALRAAQVLDAGHPGRHRRVLLRWLARDCAGRCGPLDPQPGVEQVALAHGQHLGLYRDPVAAGPADFAFLDAWLTQAERAEPLSDRLLRFIVRSFRFAPGVPPDGLMLAELCGAPELDRLTGLAHRATLANRRAARARTGFDAGRIPSAVVTRWLAERWAVQIGDLELAALDRGFDGLPAAVGAGRTFFVLDCVKGA